MFPCYVPHYLIPSAANARLVRAAASPTVANQTPTPGPGALYLLCSKPYRPANAFNLQQQSLSTVPPSRCHVELMSTFPIVIAVYM